MAEPLPPEQVRRIVGGDLSEEEAAALSHWYANLARGLSALPEADLRNLEPPLRSAPGPAE